MAALVAASGAVPSAGIRARVGAAAAPAGLSFVSIFLAATMSGGYFPEAWGWLALLFLWTAIAALTVRSTPRAGFLEWAWLGALAAFVGWVGLSAAWSSQPGRSVLELERDVIYVGAVAAAVFLLHRRSVGLFLGGLVLAVSAVAAIGTASRLFPAELGTFDSIAGYRLSEPIGYWNALGIFVAVGALVAVGLAARAETLFARALAASALVILLPTLYFTYSRGAMLSLAIGAAALVVVDPRRLQLTLAVPVLSGLPALAVWLAANSPALTETGAALGAAAQEGRRLALWLAGLAVAQAALAIALASAERRVRINRPIRLAWGVLLAVGTVAAILAVFIASGGPRALVREAGDAFTAPAVAVQPGESLNKRLPSFSGSGRTRHWVVARDRFEHSPVIGDGAGTFEGYWLQQRDAPVKVRDAHSLYLEVLGELGLVGLGLLVLALALPLVAVVKARSHPLVPAAGAAYVAYLVHAGVDWDWEMPAVTITALLCAAAAVVAARRQEARVVPVPIRGLVVAAALGLSAFSLVGLVGNNAFSSSEDALAAGKLVQAERKARRAIAWAPWSAQAWKQLGKVQLQQEQRATAGASFQEAVAIDPRDWSAWYYLGIASLGRARSRAYAEAARLNPLESDVNVLRTLGYLPAPKRRSP